ncbi:MAG: hypothetical protein ACI8RE_001022, partial [Ilumatobacter sp.]
MISGSSPLLGILITSVSTRHSRRVAVVELEGYWEGERL